MLNPVAENVWEAPAPLHSPVAIDDALRGELDALGPVRHIGGRHSLC